MRNRRGRERLLSGSGDVDASMEGVVEEGETGLPEIGMAATPGAVLPEAGPSKQGRKRKRPINEVEGGNAGTSTNLPKKRGRKRKTLVVSAMEAVDGSGEAEVVNEGTVQLHEGSSTPATVDRDLTNDPLASLAAEMEQHRSQTRVPSQSAGYSVFSSAVPSSSTLTPSSSGQPESMMTLDAVHAAGTSASELSHGPFTMKPLRRGGALVGGAVQSNSSSQGARMSVMRGIGQPATGTSGSG